MEDYILENYLNAGIDLINPNMYDSWEVYVSDIVNTEGGARDLNAILDLLTLLNNGISMEEFELYSAFYSRIEMITALMFSDRFRDTQENEKRNIRK